MIPESTERGKVSTEITRMGALDMQVCAPRHWTDAQIKEFADRNNPCGTEAGWQIRKQGDAALMGMRERNPCLEREGYTHIMLDA